MPAADKPSRSATGRRSMIATGNPLAASAPAAC
ncbi:hypothetical protein SAMN06295970_11049 [Noviherbaspirillum suwonense]|jgi:hypothetical protein|uniref:Uncharacterized protein n=1 Tax=Noviherbaspirillum suwonense TaxID=1224511 RepID=A0ABY1QE03_9BURK|nr:hypothetical protein SAMN06295970_11049 [Noviherbaspirillum suwonense]